MDFYGVFIASSSSHSAINHGIFIFVLRSSIVLTSVDEAMMGCRQRRTGPPNPGPPGMPPAPTNGSNPITPHTTAPNPHPSHGSINTTSNAHDSARTTPDRSTSTWAIDNDYLIT